MNSHALPENLGRDARWLAQAIDPQNRLIRFVSMDEAAYRAASFLDDRMLQSGLETRVCSMDETLAVAAGMPRDDARWIFHIGHVGSTLVARLLGELQGVLSIREPRSLRDLTAAPVDERTAWALGLRRLLSRTFDQRQAALVKATSFVSELAPWLVSAESSALFLFATPAKYIASILAGENSVKELVALRASRGERLRSHGIELSGFDHSNAHRSALAWACEMTSLEAAADAIADGRILWADFDRMLGDMAGGLARCAAHFGFEASSARVQELAAGPLMSRYSKALEYDYSPSLRAELIADATRYHRADMEAALAALYNAANSVPLLARALHRAERES